MILTSTAQVFVAGLCGGAALELLHWHAIRRDEKFPQYASSPAYWIITAVMACTGGLMAILYFGARADGLLALHVGASTPLLLQKLTTTVAKKPGAKSLQATPLSFMSW